MKREYRIIGTDMSGAISFEGVDTVYIDEDVRVRWISDYEDCVTIALGKLSSYSFRKDFEGNLRIKCIQ